MSLARGFRLSAGGPGPMQQSHVSCGAACLTVARMLLDPSLASWITAGDGDAPTGCAGTTPSERFGAHERLVHRRTNSVRPARDRWQTPWPVALGTPPWGAAWELEHGASRPGTRYAVDQVRLGADRGVAERLGARVRPGEPTLLYVGDDLLPRHVVLLFATRDDDAPCVYDPGHGRVHPYEPSDVVTARLGLAGWDRAWLAVRPAGARRVDRAFETERAARPWWRPLDATPDAVYRA